MAQVTVIGNKILRAIVMINPSFLSFFGMLIGGIFGFVARHFSPEDWMIKIIGLPGIIFINMLKSTVMIFVIVTMTRTPMEITAINEAKAMGSITVIYSVVTSIVSSFLGLVVTSIFMTINISGLDCPKSDDVRDIDPDMVDNSLLTSIINIAVSCFSPNLIGSVVNDNILGVVVAFLVFGFLLMVYRNTEGGKLFKNFLDVFYQVTVDLIGLIIRFTPIGIFSLIAGEMAKIKSFCIFKQLLFYLLAYSIGLKWSVVKRTCLIQCFVVYPLMFFAATRSNPFSYHAKFIGAITTAFATASSAAALPVGMQSAIEAGVNPKVVNFVMPLGATMNMDGSSIYYPATLVFIAAKYGTPLGIGKKIILAFVSALVTVGGAPVPSGALVYLYTVANAIGMVPDPAIVSLIWAIDPFMDRTLTAINVTGVAYGAKIIEVLSEYFDKKESENGEETKENSVKTKRKTRVLERTLSNSMLSNASKLLEDSIRASQKREASQANVPSKKSDKLETAELSIEEPKSNEP